MNGQGMQLKSFEIPCETPRCKTLTEDCKEVLRLSREMKMMVEEVKCPIFGFSPQDVSEKNRESQTIDDYIEMSKQILEEAVKEIYRLRERL